ncbi:TAXI family TRAP transporter solute-binding subunit [Desulfosarcina sp.]|uniref:TAXI family TRAP transporter solute-binding subunit n=1 Tax=Desulfosarcina sp. TaxID=2027861 RepID=UPI0039708930
MIRRLILGTCLAAALFLGPSNVVAAEGEAEEEQDFLGIITDDLRSTAHQIGMDLKALLKRNHIHLAVFNSSGSVENIYAVYQRPGNHLGLVQSDVLAFVAKVKTDPRLKLIADKIKWVFPLYNQEVHLLAKAEIGSFSDLGGKRVAIGHAESGSNLTSRLIFEISGIFPRQTLVLDNAQALAALKNGSIDAMVIVDGFPIDRLTLDVSPADGLHLVPINQERILAFYPASRIPGGAYPWQTTDVETVSVQAVLVAYDFRNNHCHTIGNVARLMAENLNWLRHNGHPKWRSVDLNQPVKGWEQYKCVKNFNPNAITAEPETPRVRRPNPVADAIEAVFRN